MIFLKIDKRPPSCIRHPRVNCLYQFFSFETKPPETKSLVSSRRWPHGTAMQHGFSTYSANRLSVASCLTNTHNDEDEWESSAWLSES